MAGPHSAQYGTVFEKSAAGMDAAGRNAQAGMGYQPMSINSSYQPGNIGLRGNLDPNKLAGNAQYRPTNVNAGQYNAAQLADTNLDPYMNPFTSQVIDNTMSDLDRARQMEANQANAAATAAGAFGGSRQALMQAETTRNFADRAANTAGQLRLSGFNNAQNAALQDVGAQNNASQFNIGQDMAAQMANQQARARAKEFGTGAGFQAAGLGLQEQQMNEANRLQAGQMDMQAQRANQSADLAAAQQRLAAAQQLGALSNLGFGMGQQVQGGMNNAGAQQQALMQQLINQGKGQFNQFTGAPGASMQGPGSLLGMLLGSQQTQTTSKDPGLFDYLTLGASMF